MFVLFVQHEEQFVAVGKLTHVFFGDFYAVLVAVLSKLTPSSTSMTTHNNNNNNNNENKNNEKK